MGVQSGQSLNPFLALTQVSIMDVAPAPSGHRLVFNWISHLGPAGLSNQGLIVFIFKAFLHTWIGYQILSVHVRAISYSYFHTFFLSHESKCSFRNNNAVI